MEGATRSLARHGVHDLHRAHFLLNSASTQDVLPTRLRMGSLGQTPENLPEGWHEARRYKTSVMDAARRRRIPDQDLRTHVNAA